MPDLQPLIDQVEPGLYKMLVNFFHWQPNQTTHRDAEAIAALAVGTFVRGECACSDRLRPPLGRRRDFVNRKLRCERDHGVRLAAVVGHLAESEQIPFPVKLRAKYLGHTLTAELTADGVIHFPDRDFHDLSTATQVAKESVVGKWTDRDMKVFWKKQHKGTWKPVDATNLGCDSLPVGTKLQTVFLSRPFFATKTLTAEIRADGVFFGGDTYTGLTAAAEAALESVIKDQKHTNGWQFWQYEKTKDHWEELDEMRARFWEDWGEATDQEAFWRTKAETTLSLCQTLQKAVANAAPHAIPRLISFPWLEYPDERGAEWGQVLCCARPIVTEFVYNEKQDRGTIQKWPEFIGELAAAGRDPSRSVIGHWLWMTLLARLNPTTADSLAQVATADGTKQSGLLTKGLKKEINAALNQIIKGRELLDQFGKPQDLLSQFGEILAADYDATTLLATGLPAVEDSSRLTWLNRWLLWAAFPEFVPVRQPYRNGCGNDDVYRECPNCRAAGQHPIPSILPDDRTFPKGTRFRSCAFRCKVCGKYWVADDPSDRDALCPRCGGRRTSDVYEVWTQRQTFGGDALDYLDDNDEEPEND